MRNRVMLTLMATALLAAMTPAAAQEYPAKPVRLVVPFTPGGTTDILGRLVAQKLSEAFGRQVLVDNRPGAGGNIGADLVAKSPADGYVLLLGHIGTLAVNPTLYPKLPYDAVKDFQPVTLFAMIPNLMSVNPSLPVKSVKELVALAHARPGEMNYGSAGNGSGSHLAMEYFKLMSKTQIVHIPYKGTTQALTDLIAGNISMIFTGVPTQLPHIKSGRLRALAVGNAKRLPLFPELPTVAEAGVKGYEATQWYGVVAPANTPRPIVDKLHGALVKALQSTEVKERLAAEAGEPVGNSPEEFHAYIRQEIVRWAPVIKASGAKPE